MSNPNASFQERQNEVRMRQKKNESILNKMRQQALSTMGFTKKHNEKMAEISMMEPGKQRLMAAGGYAASSVVKSGALAAVAIAGAIAKNYTDNVGLFTGNDAAKNNIENFKSKFGYTSGRIGAVIVGAKTGGAVGGPVGAAIGAVAGLAINAINRTEELRKFTFKTQERQSQTSKNAQRLGQIIVNRGR
jgi:hypothetical protein